MVKLFNFNEKLEMKYEIRNDFVYRRHKIACNMRYVMILFVKDEKIS